MPMRAMPTPFYGSVVPPPAEGTRGSAAPGPQFALLSDQLGEGTIATAHIQPTLALAWADPVEKVLAGKALQTPMKRS